VLEVSVLKSVVTASTSRNWWLLVLLATMVTTQAEMDAAQAVSLKQATVALVDPKPHLILVGRFAAMAITLTLLELDNLAILAMMEPNSTTTGAIIDAKLKKVFITYLITLI
jgi:hypothetical protein